MGKKVYYTVKGCTRASEIFLYYDSSCVCDIVVIVHVHGSVKSPDKLQLWMGLANWFAAFSPFLTPPPP